MGVGGERMEAVSHAATPLGSPRQGGVAHAFDLPHSFRGHTFAGHRRWFELHSAAARGGFRSPRRPVGCYAELSISALQGRGLHGAFGLLKCKTSPKGARLANLPE